VRFAQSHNVRLAVKASGHDLLGRSTAKDSLLIHTHKLQNLEFVDSFMVGGKNKGTAVTVGSGVNLSQLYNATAAKDKIFVGGLAVTVVAAGGYVQGGGHSALSPLYGLASDNCLSKFVVCIYSGAHQDCRLLCGRSGWQSYQGERSGES
jgi:FAD/FMN-containing dehydrogenase